MFKRRMRPAKPAKKKSLRFGEPTKCRFCRDKTDVIDYKDTASLQKLVSSQGKIFARKRSGNCAYHQRSARRAIKKARFMALMPFVG